MSIAHSSGIIEMGLPPEGNLFLFADSWSNIRPGWVVPKWCRYFEGEGMCERFFDACDLHMSKMKTGRIHFMKQTFSSFTSFMNGFLNFHNIKQ